MSLQPFGWAGRHHDVISTQSDFDEFFATRLARTRRLAHLLTGSASIAQEVAQEAFVAVHAKWAAIDNPDAYLRTTVVNLGHSVQRRQIRERRHARSIPEPAHPWSRRPASNAAKNDAKSNTGTAVTRWKLSRGIRSTADGTID